MNAAPSAEQRLLSGLGLAARAGRLKMGLDASLRSIRKGEAAALIIAGDAPKTVRRKLVSILAEEPRPYRIVLDGDRLGRAAGRERVVVMAITDRSLGRRVIELAEAVEG